jgi:DNA-binding response OmpR family regulator
MAKPDLAPARATKRVLIVDDNPATVRLLRDHLGLFRHDHDYQVETASDGAEGLAAVDRDRFDLILLDVHMPKMTGLELLAEIRRRGLGTPVLMLTGNKDGRTAGDALAAGVFAYIPKPFDFARLELLISAALSRRAATPVA